MEHYDTMQGLPFAMAYVPWQPWQKVSDGARGLEQGTIFEELIFPFEYAGPGCRNTGCCHRGCSQNATFAGMPHASCRQASPACAQMQRQRREGCSCQEITKKS